MKRLYKVFSLLTVLTLLLSGFAFGDVQRASAVGAPYIMVNPSGHWAYGWNWPLGVDVTLSVKDYSATVKSVSPSDPNLTEAYFDLTSLDLVPRDIVTVTGDNITKVLEITNFTVTDLNVAENTLSGTASPGASVWTCADNAPGGCRFATAGSDGVWIMESVDPAAFVLAPGVFGWGAEPDTDGDMTRMDWRVQFPWVVMNYAVGSQFIEGFDWPANSDVSLTIYSDGDRTEKLVGPIPQTADGAGSLIFTTEGLNVLPGMLLEMTNGLVTKEHVVLPITVSEASAETDYYAGYTTANSPIGVCIWDGSGCVSTTSDDAGYWRADFASAGIDIQPGASANVDQNDEDGDRTSLGFVIPNPRFDVRANVDQVEAWEWHLGDSLTLTVGGHSLTTVVCWCPWDPNYTYASFNLAGSIDLQPDDFVSLTNDHITKTTVVSPLEFTDIDVESDTVAGVTTPNGRVDIWACPPNMNCINRLVDADGEGHWIADFAQLGGEGQDIVDIIGGTWIDSRQWDDDSDGTMFGVTVPNPRFDHVVYLPLIVK
jgi:hypothetical protein